MTLLRKTMLEELERRNFSQSTTRTYIHTVEDFAGYFHRPPDQLGPEHVRQYQAQLFTHKHLSPNTVIQRLAALRFFFIKTLRKPWSIAETPYPKKEFHLPAILSQEEVALLDSTVIPQRLGGLFEASFWRRGARAPLSRQLHSPRRHFQPSAGRLGWWQGHVSLARLRAPQQKAPDDFDCGRVSAAISASSAAAALCSHSSFRVSRQS